MVPYHAQTSADPEGCQGKRPIFCASRDCPPSLVPRPRDSVSVPGLFLQLESTAYPYTQTCADKFSPHYSFSLTSLGLSAWQRGYKASHCVFIFNSLYFGFETNATFWSFLRPPMMWSELINSLSMDPTGPFKHYQGSCSDTARVGYKGNGSRLQMWEESTEKPGQDRWTPLASQEGTTCLKMHRIYFKNSNLVWWKTGALIPVYSCHEKYCY